jgi:hypothetical protein
MSVINTYNVFISSSQRSSGTSDNFVINMRKPIILTRPNSFFTCTVGSAEIPFNFKQLNTTNNMNVLNVFYTKEAVLNNFNITFPPGNYIITDLLNTLQSLILAVYPLLNLSFSYNKTTGLCSLLLTGYDNKATSLTLGFGTNKYLGAMFGYSASTSFSYDATNASTVSTSTQQALVNPNPCIYIRSDVLVQFGATENLVEKDVTSDILAKIQIMNLPGSWLMYSNVNNLKIILTNKVIDTISLYLSDSSSYSLSLGNLDWSVRLTFEEVERESMNQWDIHQPPEPPKELLEEKQKLLDEILEERKKVLHDENDEK